MQRSHLQRSAEPQSHGASGGSCLALALRGYEGADPEQEPFAGLQCETYKMAHFYFCIKLDKTYPIFYNFSHTDA